MGVHSLVTGLNGAGKTLFVVATKLREVGEQTIEYRGETVKRRIVQGGINGLLIEHELMYVPKLEIDPETFVDEWKGHVREPGEPPVADVPCEVFNWWLWCKPGDLIVVDECQRVFRPMPSGRRVPMYISKLETARHYGVEFLYLTQHPQLLHQNVRRLVGPHEDVRRIFGSSRVMIHQWDRVSDPGRIKQATSRPWKHDKSAYGLYRSAELHYKFNQRLPMAVWALLLGVVMLGVLGWMAFGRGTKMFHPGPAAPASAPAVPVPGAEAAAAGGAPVARVSGQVDNRWPVYQAEPVRLAREPLDGRAVQWEGSYDDGPVHEAYFGLFVEGERVATLRLRDLNAMGYTWTTVGPCVGSLRFGKLERLVTCGKRMYAPQGSGASSPAPTQVALAGGTQ